MMTAAYFIIGVLFALVAGALAIRWALRDDTLSDCSNAEMVWPISFIVIGSFASIPVWPVVAVPAVIWVALRLTRRDPKRLEQRAARGHR